MDAGNNLNAERIVHLYENSVIGFKEARTLLGEIYPEFKAVRDSTVDARADGDSSDE